MTDSRDQLTAAIAEAEAALGQATVDGAGEAAARKKLTAARDRLEAFDLADEARARREEEAEAAEAERHQAQARHTLYEWSRDYATAMKQLVEAHVIKHRAEQTVSYLAGQRPHVADATLHEDYLRHRRAFALAPPGPVLDDELFIDWDGLVQLADRLASTAEADPEPKETT